MGGRTFTSWKAVSSTRSSIAVHAGRRCNPSVVLCVLTAPVGAPANISSHNVTLNSAEVRWSPIPEEQVRGFLRGYVLHLVYSDQRGVKTETSKPELVYSVCPELDFCFTITNIWTTGINVIFC